MKQMPKSKAEEMLERKEKDEEAKAIQAKEFEELKIACQKVFSTPTGIMLAKDMMKKSGIYRLEKECNNVGKMSEERGREGMYLYYVKHMLTPEQLLKIERR